MSEGLQVGTTAIVPDVIVAVRAAAAAFMTRDAQAPFVRPPPQEITQANWEVCEQLFHKLVACCEGPGTTGLSYSITPDVGLGEDDKWCDENHPLTTYGMEVYEEVEEAPADAEFAYVPVGYNVDVAAVMRLLRPDREIGHRHVACEVHNTRELPWLNRPLTNIRGVFRRRVFDISFVPVSQEVVDLQWAQLRMQQEDAQRQQEEAELAALELQRRPRHRRAIRVPGR